MVTRTAKIRNEYGIHCRPSALIAKRVADYAGTVTVRHPDGREAQANSVLSLIGLGLPVGTSVSLEVDGPDEETVATEMVKLFETKFDFER